MRLFNGLKSRIMKTSPILSMCTLIGKVFSSYDNQVKCKILKKVFPKFNNAVATVENGRSMEM